MVDTLKDVVDFPDVCDMMAGKYLCAIDLPPCGEVVTITRVRKATEVFEGGRKDRVNLISVTMADGQTADIVFPKTNVAALRILLGDVTREWIGKRILLVPDLDRMKGEVVSCIRVQSSPDAPRGRAKAYQMAWDHSDGRMNGIPRKTSLITRLKAIIGKAKTAAGKPPPAPISEPEPPQPEPGENDGP